MTPVEVSSDSPEGSVPLTLYVKALPVAALASIGSETASPSTLFCVLMKESVTSEPTVHVNFWLELAVPSEAVTVVR